MLSSNVLKKNIIEFISNKFKKKDIAVINLCIVNELIENISILSDDSYSIICIFNDKKPNSTNKLESKGTVNLNSIYNH